MMFLKETYSMISLIPWLHGRVTYCIGEFLDRAILSHQRFLVTACFIHKYILDAHLFEEGGTDTLRQAVVQH